MAEDTNSGGVKHISKKTLNSIIVVVVVVTLVVIGLLISFATVNNSEDQKPLTLEQILSDTESSPETKISQLNGLLEQGVSEDQESEIHGHLVDENFKIADFENVLASFVKYEPTAQDLTYLDYLYASNAAEEAEDLTLAVVYIEKAIEEAEELFNNEQILKSLNSQRDRLYE